MLSLLRPLSLIDFPRIVGMSWQNLISGQLILQICKREILRISFREKGWVAAGFYSAGRRRRPRYPSLARRSTVSPAVHSIFRQKVMGLIEGTLPADSYGVTWDGTHSQGHRTGSRVYFCRLIAGYDIVRQKMIVLK